MNLRATDHPAPTTRRSRVKQSVIGSVLGKRPQGLICRHLCGLPWCKEHLTWGTTYENAMDRYFHRKYGHGAVAPTRWETF